MAFIPPAPANPPAGGSVVVSGVVARTATTSPAAPLSAAQQERQRLFAAATKELGEAKAALDGGATGELVGAASRPAESAQASPGLAGAVTEARGAKVKIALGARNGLRSDTRMYVHRGSQFIGVLQLTTIEDQTAEGVVDGRMSANVGDQAVVFGD
ncbi:MAG: hypothetical protein NT031_12205 [Planctomycetota bacterium]|nr:hypothetical protein [Planctomycetota bacterium]